MDARTPIESSTGCVALSTSFNLNCDCFVVATNSGFQIFDAATCRPMAKRALRDGGVGMIQIFGRTNILPLVGGSKRPASSANKVLVWNDKVSRFQLEIACPVRVRGLRVLERRLVIVLRDEVRIYSIEGRGDGVDATLDSRFPTAPNSTGLCSVSHSHLAFPGRTPGHVQLVRNNSTQSVSIIPVHASALGAIALSRDGALLATASEKGTLIRVWSTATNARVAELRRGVDQVTIYALGFNPSGTLLACTSDKGTLHVFDIPIGAATAAAAEEVGESSSAPGTGDEWNYANSDVGGGEDFLTSGAEGPGDAGRWGVLGKLPFMPQYFRDTVSFASAEFALDDGPGPNRQREAEEAATIHRARLPRGNLGWTNDNTVVVLGAGIEAKYERFIVTTDSEGRRVCVRQAWANYLTLD